MATRPTDNETREPNTSRRETSRRPRRCRAAVRHRAPATRADSPRKDRAAAPTARVRDRGGRRSGTTVRHGGGFAAGRRTAMVQERPGRCGAAVSVADRGAASTASVRGRPSAIRDPRVPHPYARSTKRFEMVTTMATTTGNRHHHGSRGRLARSRRAGPCPPAEERLVITAPPIRRGMSTPRR